MRARISRRRGIVNIWVVMTLFVMVALVGLACDAGWCVLVLNQLQAAADSAALAGAQKVKADQTLARQAARDLAFANKAATTTVKLHLNDDNADPDGDIVIGRFNRNTQVFTATTANPNAVKVIANRTATGIDGPVPLVFGQSFGAPTVQLSRTAIAMIAGGTGAGMLVLDPTAECSLSINGNANLQVNDGVIQVNSSNSCAVCNNGNPVIQASDMNVVGSSCLDSDILTGDVHNGAPVVPDPLIGLLAPPIGEPKVVDDNGTDSILPGYYLAGIERVGGTLTMAPGIYVVEGTGGSGNNSGGFNLGGNSSVVGHGVMIYVRTGSVRINGGSGNKTLSPPGSGDPPVTFEGWEPYEHITIFQARGNTSEAFINGSTGVNLTGTMYFPSNLINLSGSGLGYGNQLIANRVHITGNGNVLIAYDGSFIAGAGGHVFLVE